MVPLFSSPQPVARRACRCVASLAFALLLFAPAAGWAMDRVSFKKDGKLHQVAGRVQTEAEDGGILFLATDGMIWAIQPDELVERTKDEEPFRAIPRDALADRLLAELPAGFKLHTTVHYLICYNTSSAYAQWCGSLYERLYRAFHNYWENRGFKLQEPELPLVALVFDSQASYTRYVKRELGDTASTIVGFYSPTTNRVNMYDLTGVEGLKLGNERLSNSAAINQILQQPAAAPTVATIVHEATHQLAYNCGLQTRMADNPVWVSEGLAVYFETPDLRNAKGWGSIGAVNRGRLLQFAKYLSSRPADSLTTLLQDDKRFQDPQTALDAYAEAWALNYYLLRTKSKDYVAYLKTLAGKPPALYDDPTERLKEFQQFFGTDLRKFDSDFVRYIRGL